MNTNTETTTEGADKSHSSPSPCSALFLEVEAGVRYWEDATVNGVEDSQGDLIPMKEGELWKPRINLKTGQIEGWPDGVAADVHYKVCDAGKYWLTDENRNRLKQWNGYYVPDDFLCVGDTGYGDYIILKIGTTGKIEGWREPAIEAEEWINL